MSTKKGLYLFLALLLPGLIYVFLKQFGKNEFDLEIFHKEGVVASPCSLVYSQPHLVPDSLWNNAKRRASLFVAINDMESLENISKLGVEFDTAEFEVIQLDTTQRQIADCVLLLRKPWTVALVDTKNQIRGYYAPSTREEFDRLKMEMSILLKKY